MLRHTIACSLIAAALALAGCETDRNEPQTTALPATPDVKDVVEESGRFYGQKVTLVGEVDEVFGPRSFELEGLDWIFDDELTVMTSQPVRIGSRGITDDDEVIVTGVVHRRSDTELRSKLGWDPQEVDMEDEAAPVVIAESIRTIGDLASWSAAEPQTAVISLWTLYVSPNAEELEDKNFTVSDVEVRSKMGKGLWVGESHLAQIFVKPPKEFDLSTVDVGDDLRLVGIVRKMPSPKEAMQRWDLPATMKEPLAQQDVYVEASVLEKVEEKQNDRRAALSGEEDDTMTP